MYNMNPDIKTENKVFVLMGDANERKFNTEILNRHGHDLQRTGNCYDNSHWQVKDYKSPSKSVELKSRAVKSTDYYDTMVGANKVDEYKGPLDHENLKNFFFTTVSHAFVITSDSHFSRVCIKI